MPIAIIMSIMQIIMLIHPCCTFNWVFLSLIPRPCTPVFPQPGDEARFSLILYNIICRPLL